VILFVKALRAVWSNKRAYVACVLLMSMGVLMNNAMGVIAGVFSSARDAYYEDYRLADVFAKVRAMPMAAVAEIGQIDGVSEAAGRYVTDARILMPGNDKLVTLRISSIDRSYGGMPLNGIIVTGNDFSEPSDIMVNAAFLEAHGLSRGDTVRAVIERREYDLTVCAVADSPEYVYPIRDMLEFLPNPETFGYGFMSLEGLWTLADKRGFFNDVCVLLEGGYAYESVRPQLEDRLSKFGLIEMRQRKDQPSVAIVDMELDAIGAMSGAMPAVFMLMSVLVLYLMLKRIIEQERAQIGVLKAFGYGGGAVMAHYVLYGAVTGFAGGVAGSLMGFAALGPYIDMFKQFFNLPTKDAGIPAFLIFRGFAISIAAGSAGGYFGARRSLRLSPAESMRPEAPKIVGKDVMERLPFLRAVLNSSGNLAVRGIARNKMRSAVIVTGIMFAFGMLCFMGSYNVMIDFMIMNQFEKVQRYDAKVHLIAPEGYERAVGSVYGIDGVEIAEGVLELPVVLANRHLSVGAKMTGVKEDSLLYAIYDNDADRVLKPPRDGVILNDVLARLLAAKNGDVISISSPHLEEDLELAVTGVVMQNLSQGCYMEMGAMAELFRMDGAVTSVVANAGEMAGLTRLLDEAENVSHIEDKAETARSYVELMEPFSALIYVMWVVAVVMAFAIIYNTSTITLSERKREYATLRVVGLQIREVGAIMGFEYWALCFVGMALGIPFNYLLKQSLAGFFASDMFTFPVFTPPEAYLQAVAGCLAAVFLSNRSASRQIGRFDMVDVLKEHE